MALNAILAALLSEFASTQQITNLDVSEQFEHFVNFSLISDLYASDFNTVDVSTGNQEFGLDGIAVIANGALIEDIDEIDDLVEKNKYLDVDFIFTQAKTAQSFDSGDMLKTLFAVEDFFKDLKLLQGERVRARADLKDHIYKLAAHFRRRSPSLQIFYASGGTWKGDANLEAVIQQRCEAIESSGLFSTVKFGPIDAGRLQQLYFQTKNAIRRQVAFEKSVPLPAIAGVTEAHIGVLPAAEYLKLVEDENGGIKKLLFFDNMRDYIEDSSTNREIADTLTSERRSEFPLRNNGVTVVARNLHRVGNKFDIEDYQIVNGCQTSHVLFNERNSITSDVVVPVKIIVTEDEEVTNSIIRGSNFSNQFHPSQLWATEPFHKDLEIFFHNHHTGDEQLYYERRKGQFGSGAHIEKVRIVTPQSLLKYVASMYLSRPHDVTKYYSALEPEAGKTVFVKGQNPFAYHAAAYASFRLESLFRNKHLPAEYKPLRHHLLFGIKSEMISGSLNLADKGMEALLRPMMTVLQDTAASTHAFLKLIERAEDKRNELGIESIRQLAKSVQLRDAFRTNGSQN